MLVEFSTIIKYRNSVKDNTIDLEDSYTDIIVPISIDITSVCSFVESRIMYNGELLVCVDVSCCDEGINHYLLCDYASFRSIYELCNGVNVKKYESLLDKV